MSSTTAFAADVLAQPARVFFEAMLRCRDATFSASLDFCG